MSYITYVLYTVPVKNVDTFSQYHLLVLYVLDRGLQPQNYSEHICLYVVLPLLQFCAIEIC